MINKTLNKKMELFHDSFSPEEVQNLVIKSIDSQINNHKIKNLSNWEHNHNCDQEPTWKKIKKLEERKAELMGICQQAKKEGCNIRLSDQMEITIDQ